jgi:NAD-dependent protein deacetylase/lipoamidase
MAASSSHADDSVAALERLIAAARRAVIFTGAGISTESGIPDFRSPGGLWTRQVPIDFASFLASESARRESWRRRFESDAIFRDARPNRGHRAVAALVARGKAGCIITQNIDGLHQQAGSRDVIEFHGTFAFQRCMLCGQRWDSRQVSLETLPPRCACGGLLRPDVIMFGEIIPTQDLQRSRMLAAACDAMLVVGTSATVQPAAYLPVIAKRNGAAIVEINPEPTPLTADISDVTLIGAAGKIMRDLVATINQVRMQNHDANGF